MTLSLVLLFTFAHSVKIPIKHTCPGGRSVCPDLTTCCLIGTGIYGCCPMMDAVCCDDLVHCCPPATKCDVVHRQCLQNEVIILRDKQTESLNEETGVLKSSRLLSICSGGNSSFSVSQACCGETDDES